MMKVINNTQDCKHTRSGLLGSVGFVPTMGALHEGHFTLVKKSIAENDHTFVSIFVNPTQFNNPEDLKKYPLQIEKDLEMLRKLSVDVVFNPTFEQMYPDNYKYKVSENDLSKILCGAHRPGHFDGVLTVVMKLFNITKPHRAYFGEKDFQQYLLIKNMTDAFFMDIEIIPVPIVREQDGLAMSSRNVRLTPEARKQAPLLFEYLKSSLPLDEIKTELEQKGFEVDYLVERDSRRYIAATLNNVRLIDNVQI